MVGRCTIALVLAMLVGTAQAADWLHLTPAPATAPAPQAVPAVAVPAKPTFELMQQDVQDKNYQHAVLIAAALLADSTVHNRYEILMLKAQCHLYLKAPDLAADAFGAAAKSTKDPKEMALGTANHIVVGHASQLAYTPKFTRDTPLSSTPAASVEYPDDGNEKKKQKKSTKAPEEPATDPFAIKFTPAGYAAKPIDIVDPDSRQTALQALYVDELDRALPRLEAAKKGQEIPAILDAINKIAMLGQLELAATNADAETSSFLKSLMAHASKIMSAALETQTTQERQIKTQANQTTTGTNLAGYRVRMKQGLTSDERTALQNMISFCGEIVQTCKAFDAAPGVDATTLDTVSTQADALAKRASTTLNARY